eukprot:gb/GECH01010003.1/.p1 GENE.gb/GECH01010003.1/~~gb/GECH01010003.1/.p1  ORF type:complete len:603 (+),score=127.86 gb/GECH01010003.1/:1-1809(+)
MSFYQDPPRYLDPYQHDTALQDYLSHTLPRESSTEINQDLERFGKRMETEIYDLGLDAENNPPQLEQYDAWGRRQDKVKVSEGWDKLRRVSAEEGLVSIAYERRHGAYSRVHQFAKLYLFTAASAIFTCPLAMTDGAARTLQINTPEGPRPHPVFSDAYQRLTTRDPDVFWTSGQWMTERPGGSDVGRTETTATRLSDGTYALTGFKWFASAVDGDMSLGLARVVDDEGMGRPGSAGLSLFLIPIRDNSLPALQGLGAPSEAARKMQDGASSINRLNNIRIHRLKNKLGTHALPTGEVSLHSSRGVMVGRPGRGVPHIASMLNITRIYNSISAVSFMRQALFAVQDYARRRQAFGKRLTEHPLHVHTMAKLEVEVQACLFSVLDAALLLGKAETDTASESELRLLRLVTPVMKLYTGKRSIQVVSECLEGIGGQGYIEDTGLPALLRNTQVLPIWEGTTNVLSLDTLRAIIKQPDVLNCFRKHVTNAASAAFQKRKIPLEARELLTSAVQKITASLKELLHYSQTSKRMGKEFSETGAREYAMRIAHIFMATSLLQHTLAQECQLKDVHILSRFVLDHLVGDTLTFGDQECRKWSHAIACRL